MKPITPINEEHQAELLEHYLSGLDNGDAFSIPKEVNDPELDAELIELMKFSKDVKVAAQPAILPAILPAEFSQRKRHWLWWLTPVPVIGIGATLSVMFYMSQSTNQLNSGVPLSDAEKNLVVQELALIDEIDADVSASLNDYDTFIADTETLIDEQSYDDLQTLFDVSEL